MKSDKPYVRFQINKSEKSRTYYRSFNKIDNFLSYIGGLIGTFISICFIINKYAEVEYCIKFSYQIFGKEAE